MTELKAASVLQDRLNSLDNVTVLKNAQVKEITGTDSVNGLTYVDRNTEEEKQLELAGVFVQIGLVPNTNRIVDTVKRNKIDEIIVDNSGATNVQGVCAAEESTDITNTKT